RLSILTDLLADRADIAPIGPDSAAIGGKPDVLVPGLDDSIERIGDAIEEARDRQASVRPAVRQDRRRRHEPQPGDVVIYPLRVPAIVRIGESDSGEHLLEALARKKIAVLQG